MFSGWRRVCGSPSQGGGGKYSHCVCRGWGCGGTFSVSSEPGRGPFPAPWWTLLQARHTCRPASISFPPAPRAAAGRFLNARHGGPFPWNGLVARYIDLSFHCKLLNEKGPLGIGSQLASLALNVWNCLISTWQPFNWEQYRPGLPGSVGARCCKEKNLAT